VLCSNGFSDSETFTVENETEINRFNDVGVNAWGLDQSELREYKIVMQGNRRFWSPNLHPLAALGMREGITIQERDELAEKLVRIERARLQREIAFEKAFQSANRKLFSHIPLFEITSAETLQETNLSAPKNVEYYLETPCKQCKSKIQQWMRNNIQVDMYIHAESDREIREFAKNMGISPLLVPTRFRLHRLSKQTMKQMGIALLPHTRLSSGKVQIQ